MTEEFVRRLLDETREEINRADSKANILLAGASLAIALLGGAALSGDISIAGARGAVQTLAVLSVAAALAGLTLFGLAVLPRLGSAEPGRARYFADHAQYETADELCEAIRSEADDEARRHAEQLRDLSLIVSTKYQYTVAGELVIGAGLLMALLAAVLDHLLG